jgi:phage terminase large subunit-like protein
MSPPMIEMEGLVLSQKIHHDGDPVLAWMVSNVVAHRTGELLQPRKDAEDKKIDGVTALLMCLQRGMYRNTAQADYEARGLWSI